MKQIKAEEFQMKVEFANTTSAEAMWQRLRQTEAHILLIAEAHIPEEGLPEASARARKESWILFWTPACRKKDLKYKVDAGSSWATSGGAAILVRDFLGLRAPQGENPLSEWTGEIHRSRVVGGIVSGQVSQRHS